MRAGISSENSSIRRSGMAAVYPVGVTQVAATGAVVTPVLFSWRAGLTRACGLRRRMMVAMHVEGEAGEAELARKLDGHVIRRLLGRKRVGLAERHQDRPAALVRDDVI